MSNINGSFGSLAGSYPPSSDKLPTEEQMKEIKKLGERLAEKGLPHHKEYHPETMHDAQRLISIMYKRLRGDTSLEE